MNKVFLIGNLTRDPELSETNSGVSVCRFGLAVNRRRAQGDGEPQVDFFNVTAWRRRETRSPLREAFRSATTRTIPARSARS